jgi:radical SAM protein with 4Fe4S-binding SPASM domain
MESEMRKILRFLLKRRYINPSLISKETGIEEYKVFVLLARLEAEGYIKRLTFEEGKSCESCPLRGICGGSCPTGTGKITIYTITKKGEDFIRKEKE